MSQKRKPIDAVGLTESQRNARLKEKESLDEKKLMAGEY